MWTVLHHLQGRSTILAWREIQSCSYLDPLALLALLGTVLGDHVELPDLVLQRSGEGGKNRGAGSAGLPPPR